MIAPDEDRSLELSVELMKLDDVIQWVLPIAYCWTKDGKDIEPANRLNAMPAESYVEKSHQTKA